MTTAVLSRRGVVRGSLVALAGAVAGFLVARTSSAARGPAGSTAANAYGPASPSSSRPLVALEKVPRGGGVILADRQIVVTRGDTDEVHAFSAVCTHQGCTVYRVAAGTIDCPCHGSRFDATTGAVRAGPAPGPLPSVPVHVEAGQVYSP